MVGASDENGANPVSRHTSMGDVFATVYKAFGIDWTKEYDTPIGRPIKIANSLDDTTAGPIQELLRAKRRPLRRARGSLPNGNSSRICGSAIS